MWRIHDSYSKRDAETLFVGDMGFEEVETAELQARLTENPDDLTLRCALLHRFAEKTIRQGKPINRDVFEQLCWFIKNRPRAQILIDCILPTEADKNTAVIKKLWQKWFRPSIDLYSGDLLLRYHASQMFLLCDPKWSRKLLLQCHKADPEFEDWPRLLANPMLATDEAGLNECVDYALKTLAMHKRRPREGYLEQRMGDQIGVWSEVALQIGRLDACKKFADTLLRRKDVYPDRWLNCEGVVYFDLISRIALKKKNLQKCEENLFSTLEFFGQGLVFEVRVPADLLRQGHNALASKFLEKLKGCVEEYLSRLSTAERNDFGAAEGEIYKALKGFVEGAKGEASGLRKIRIELLDREPYELVRRAI